MFDNVLKHGKVWINDNIGNVELNYSDINSLLDLSEASIVDLYPGDILCIECELLDRISLNNIEYYFIHDVGDNYRQTVASGIYFEYKNDENSVYTQLNTVYNDQCYFADIDTDLFAPRFIRLTHDLNVSGSISVSGSVTGFSAVYNDSHVNFGIDGSLSNTGFTCIKDEEFVLTVPIYNNTNKKAKANVQLPPNFIYLDDYLYLGLSNSGPWTKVTEFYYNLSKYEDLSRGFLLQNSDVVNNQIVIDGEVAIDNTWASNNKYAIYTTQVFNTGSLTYTPILINNLTSSLNTRICVDDDDLQSTIEVKCDDDILHYYAYRTTNRYHENHPEGLTRGHYFRDNYVKGANDVLFLSTDALSTYGTYSSNIIYLKDYFILYNNKTEWSIILHNTYNGNGYFSVYMINQFNEIYADNVLLNVSDEKTVRVFKAEFETYGGFWIHFYCSYGAQYEEIADPGHYLMHFDVDLDITFKYFTEGREIYDFSCDYTSGDLWYTLPSRKILRKVDMDGNIIEEFKDIERDEHGLILNDLRGCSFKKNDGYWYINGDYLVEVNGENNIVRYFSFDKFYNQSALGYVYVYNDESLILRKGNAIIKLRVSGDLGYGYVDFVTDIESADIITVVEGKGIWVYSMLGYSYFIDIGTGDILYTVGDALESTQRVPGYIMKDVDNDLYGRFLPLNIDTVWNEISFHKVNTSNYYFMADKYYQVRLTLRVNKPYDIYDVPSNITSWMESDSFENEIGYNTPYDHRWDYNTDVHIDYIEDVVTISGGETININENVCILPGHLNPLEDIYDYISSKDRWYFKNVWNDGTFDFTLDYLIPESNTGDFTFNFKTTPSYEYNNSIESIYIRRESGIMHLGYKSYGQNNIGTWEDYSDEVDITDSFERYGRLRLHRDGVMTYFSTYNFSLEEWNQVFSVNRSTINGNNYRQLVFGSDPNFYIRIDYKGTGSLYLLNFVKNQSDTFWFFNSPKIDKLYLNDVLITDYIYPNNYQNVYIKAVVPKTAGHRIDDINTYELRSWWETY